MKSDHLTSEPKTNKIVAATKFVKNDIIIGDMSPIHNTLPQKTNDIPCYSHPGRIFDKAVYQIHVLNHACVPNTCLIFSGDKATLITIANEIEVGEEITYSYIDEFFAECPELIGPVVPLKVRQMYGFVCKCNYCIQNQLDQKSDEELQEMVEASTFSKAMKKLDLIDKIIDDPKTIHSLTEMLNQYHQTRLKDRFFLLMVFYRIWKLMMNNVSVSFIESLNLKVLIFNLLNDFENLPFINLNRLLQLRWFLSNILVQPSFIDDYLSQYFKADSRLNAFSLEVPAFTTLQHLCSYPDCENRKTLQFAKFKCSLCEYAKYCNQECQKKHWPRHKLFHRLLL